MKEIHKAKTAFPKYAAAIFAITFLMIMIYSVAAQSGTEASATGNKPEETTAEQILLPATIIYTTEQQEETTPLPTAEPEADKRYYNIPLAEELQDYIFEITAEYGVPAELVIAIIANESSYRPGVTGAAGERGYMQIHPINFETLTDKLGVTDFYDPKQNILCGVYMLSRLCTKYETRNEVLMCYNCGETGAARLWKQGVTETNYCRKITTVIDGLTYQDGEK